MNQILMQKITRLSATFLIILVLLLSFGKEQLHNHKPDLKEHEGCPVVLINQILNSGITIHFEFPAEHFFELSFSKTQNISLAKSDLPVFFLRSPPLI